MGYAVTRVPEDSVGEVTSSQLVVEQECDSIFPQVTCDDTCQFCQQLHLLDYLYALNGPNWTNNTNWPPLNTTTFEPHEHCSWWGVLCCGEDHTLSNVSHPELVDYTLTSDTACDVPYGVSVILLGANNVTGKLQQDFLHMSALRISLNIVVLNDNMLSGRLQESTSRAPYLRYINLDKNMMTGSLPPAIFSSTSLVYISLVQNQLTGQLPEFAALSTLEYIDVSHNNFNNSIPSSWLDNPSLAYFSASYNQLTGIIPPLQTNSSRLLAGWPKQWTTAEIRLQSNHLTGTIPPELGYMPITVLDLASNMLTGPIEQLLTGLPVLRVLRVNDNLLTGCLPSRFGSSHIESLSIKNNELTGTIPASIADLDDLTEILMQSNNFSGPFPDSMASLVGLEMLTATASGLRYLGDVPNAQNNFLPNWLYFNASLGLTSVASINYLLCYPLRVNKTVLPNLVGVGLDPNYYHYQGCMCAQGYNLEVVDMGQANETRACTLAVSTFDQHKSLIVVVTTSVGGVAIIMGGVMALLFLLRVQLAAFTLARAKKRGPPGQGKMVTLVSTDVEASTELWEWDRDAMDAATKVHDRIMRSQLSRFHGYEVTTEGDSFLIAFHEPADAIAWAITMQQELLVAKWPMQLQQHERTCIRWMADSLVQSMALQSDTANLDQSVALQEQPSASDEIPSPSMNELPRGCSAPAEPTLEKAPSVGLGDWGTLQPMAPTTGPHSSSEIAFRGLSVRMTIVTGRAEKVTVHGISRRMEYEGEVMKLLKALDSVSHGGQILIEPVTYAAINSIVADIAKSLPARPDFENLAKNAKIRAKEAAPGFYNSLQPINSSLPLMTEPPLPGRHLLTKTSWRSCGDLVGSMQRPSAEAVLTIAEVQPQDASGGKQGLLSSVRDALNRTYSKKDSAKSFDGCTSSRRKLNKIDSTHSGEYLASDTVESIDRGWMDILFRRTPLDHGRKATDEALVTMELGQHALKAWPEPLQLYQVLVPGLEDRALLFPNLTTIEQITPGYFDAPGARQAMLGGPQKNALPSVTLVFCSVENLAAIKEQTAGTVAVALYLSVVRRLLKRSRGYECQESNCTFMLAFESVMEATQFCIAVQEELMCEAWGEDVLKIKECRVMYGESKQMLFYGPRVKMGIYKGIPARICPHTTTGRADYFGPLVNRAARFCSSAAHGGQIVAPLDAVQQIISEWIQQPCPPMLEHGEPVTFIRKEADPTAAAAFVNPLSRIQSMAHEENMDLEEADKLKSLRIMEWVQRDSPIGGQPDNLIVDTPISMPCVRSSDLDSSESIADRVPVEHTEASAKTSSGLLAEMQASARQRAARKPANGGLSLIKSPSLGSNSSKRASSVSKEPQRPPDMAAKLTRSPFAGFPAKNGSTNGDNSQPDRPVWAPMDNGRLALESSKTASKSRRRKSSVRGRCSFADYLSWNPAPSVISTVSNNSSNTSLIHSDAWKAVLKVEARHIGDMKFKGVAGTHTVMQINNARHANRKFPLLPPSGKAELVAPGQGLVYTVVLNRNA